MAAIFKKKRMSTGDVVFEMITKFFAILVMLVVLYPLVYVLSASISDPYAVASGEMWLFPIDITFEGYERVLNYREVWVGYGNTVFYTVIGTLLALVVTLPAAYAMARPEFIGRGVLTVFIMITMFFSGGMIPTYLNIKSLGLLDTRMLMIICGASQAYNLIVARTFFASLPSELVESGRMDGASNARVFVSIILPLSKPIIAVMVLYFGISHWNDFMTPLIYLKTRELWPLQLFLKEILIQSQVSSEMGLDDSGVEFAMQMQRIAQMVKYTTIVVSSLPMLVIYPFLQKYFVKGVMIGAVKG